jgi:hypothetical protein
MEEPQSVDALEQELAEGYKANSAQARSACEEFAYVDGDVV